jgi:hypothetical protein
MNDQNMLTPAAIAGLSSETCALTIWSAHDATLFVGVLLNAQVACLIARTRGLSSNRSAPLCREAFCAQIQIGER